MSVVGTTISSWTSKCDEDSGGGLHSVPASILSLMRVGLHEHQVLIRVSENRHCNCSIEQTIYWAAKSSPLVIDY